MSWIKSTLCINENTMCCSHTFSLNNLIWFLSICMACARFRLELQNGRMIYTISVDAYFLILCIVQNNFTRISWLICEILFICVTVLLGVFVPFCYYCYFMMLLSCRNMQSISVSWFDVLFSSPWSSYYIFFSISKVIAIIILSLSSSVF